MANPYSALAMSAFTIGTNNYLGSLKTFTFNPDVQVEDGAGVAQENEINIPVKVSHNIDFTMFANNLAGSASSSLDITVLSVGGTSYLGAFKGGSLNVTLKSEDASPATQLVKAPIPIRRAVELTCDFMVFTAATFANTILAGVIANYAVTVIMTAFGEAIQLPMVMSASSYKVDRGMIQMENVTFKLHGPPSGPADTTLIGLAITGSAQCLLVADTGLHSYTTAVGQFCTIEKLTANFKDGGLTEMTGRLVSQGPLTLGAP